MAPLHLAALFGRTEAVKLLLEKGADVSIGNRDGNSYGDEPEVRPYYEREGLRYHGPVEMFPPAMTIARPTRLDYGSPWAHRPAPFCGGCLLRV